MNKKVDFTRVKKQPTVRVGVAENAPTKNNEGANREAPGLVAWLLFRYYTSIGEKVISFKIGGLIKFHSTKSE